MAISSVHAGQIACMVHIGRQPIHDVDSSIYGYELLFRDAGQARTALVDDGDGDQATTSTILAAFSDFAVHDLLGGLPGFVNLTRAFLVGQLPVPFETDQAVLEVLETVSLDQEVLAGVEQLHAQGYQIALDDFVWTPGAERLIELASIVKIDVLEQTWEGVMETVEHCRRPGVRAARREGRGRRDARALPGDRLHPVPGLPPGPPTDPDHRQPLARTT